MFENKGEMFAFITEVISFFAVIVLSMLDADMKTIVTICTLYLSLVIRHSK